MLKEKTGEKEFFEELYKDGRDSWKVFSDTLRKEKFEKRAEIVKQMLEKIHFSNAVDIGCGEGDFDKAIGIMPVGVDISQKALKIALENKAIKRAVCANAVKLPFSKESFGLTMLFETLYYQDPERMIAEASRITKKNGFLLASIGNKEDFGKKAREFLGGKKDQEMIFSKSRKSWFEKKQSFSELERLLEKNGFEIVEWHGVLLNVPVIARKSKALRKLLLFPLGSLLNGSANQMVILARKVTA